MSKPSVNIIGAGFSGLTTAYFLLGEGFDITIYESRAQPGGLISTGKVGHMPYETAANGFLSSRLLEDLCDKIQVPLVPVGPLAKRRYIFWHSMQRWPLSIFESVQFIGLVIRFLFAKNSLKPLEMESISAWAKRIGLSWLLGKMLQPALQGIYAGDVNELSACLILAPLFKKKSATRAKFKGTVAPPQGMGQFMVGLSSYLIKNGVVFHYSKNLTELPSDGLTVVATSASEAHKLLPEIGELPMLDVARATIGLNTPTKTIGGFGVLFAKNQGYRALGALSNSEAFPDRPGTFNETWIFGGASDAQALELSDEALLKQITEERQKLLQVNDRFIESIVVRWPQGLPNYNLVLERRLKETELKRKTWESKGIFLVGNYLGSLGLSRILQSNLETTERITEYAKGNFAHERRDS